MSYTVRCDLYVFSAHAEVVPLISCAAGGVVGILRARGGSSDELFARAYAQWYSPRTRR